MKKLINNQNGAILVIFALTLIVLVGFAALGTEVGRWYLTRVELSKAVDAAALAGAANISNPNIDVVVLTKDFGMENFQPGYIGTPATGDKSVSFSVAVQDGGRLAVTGRTNSVAILARVFDIEYVATRADGVAQKNRVEIMMVLDRSGSMAGSPLSDLKDAGRGFLDYYKDTEDEDKIGLVTFATGVKVNCQLNHNFFTPIQNAINAMSATGATNIEDALARAGAAFEDQSTVAAANRIQQYIVFFTDGRPTAFRSTFVRNGAPYDAVVCSTGNCDSNNDVIYQGPDTNHSGMGYPDTENWYLKNTLASKPTGDGKPTGTTVCKSGKPLSGYLNTQWGSFSAYPVSGMGGEAYPAYCSISETQYLNGKNGYICRTARQMAIDRASALKARLVKIYAIGLGNVDEAFLGTVASGSDYVSITPNSSELESIFKKIAKDIKLRLVQ